MPIPPPNSTSIIFDSSVGSSLLSNSPEACESFLESYSRGNIDVGGIEPPGNASSSVAADILVSGHFPPPEPPDEPQRVRELYQFRVLKELNHDVKLGLNRFARLATLMCDVKISIINFLDDKTQYTSAEAAPAPWLVHTPIERSLSICGHTILRRSAEVFEIPDTTKDWRFRGKPYVVGEPYIRYYAGAPLRTKSGYNIGSLCVLDYVPKKLSESQAQALKDLADMIMTDLELHRDKELVALKGRMANSITQFTRGLIKRDLPVIDIKMNDGTQFLARNRTKDKRRGWSKRTSSADRTRESQPSKGAMGFQELGAAQKAVDASQAVKLDQGSDDGVETDTDSVSSQGMDEVDLKAMYRYACRLMRETLDVEGVCFVDIDGIDWGTALSAPNYRDEWNTATHTSGSNRREFGAASSILGYSHTENFGAQQRKEWPSIARWDEEAETTNPNSPEARNHIGQTGLNEAFLDSEFPSETGHSLDDGSYVSTRTGNQFDDGGLSNQFLANFLSKNPYGKIFNDGLPGEVRDFLPKGVTSAILVPIYNFDQHPFAISCAYSTNPHRRFVDAEQRYLEGFGSQILSQVLKKRIIMADRAKALFISNISHELRSPLHGILASAEFLADTRLDTLQRTFIDTIDSCGRTLLEVINQVLEFGKLTYIERLKNKVSRPHIQRSTSKESVSPTMNAGPVDLMAITEQIAESCYAGHEFKGIFGPSDVGSLTNEMAKNDRKVFGGYGRAKDPSSALTVVIDVDYRDRGWFFSLPTGPVQRILMNITGNALKYTSRGWVRVHLSSSDGSDGQEKIHITVSDSGKGISPEFLRSRLFSPFTQEDTLQAGTGLGMSIVKQFVDRLGGQINVTSQVNVGTKVHVTLPATPAEKSRGPDICARVRSLTKDMKVFLAGFDKDIPASRLLYKSVAHYLTNWYNMQLVDDVHSSDLIVSDECPELHDYFQQRSPTEYSAFSPPLVSSPQSANTPGQSQSVYRAWQPLIVLCSNALRYELFGQQAETGKIIDFSSKPCGPYKLARSLLFCLEQAETRRRSLDVMMDQMSMTSTRHAPSRTSSAASTSTDDLSPISEQPERPRRGSLGKGVVRFSPSVRRGSADLGASMYVPGKGFIPAQTSSIVEPPRFVGVRRKSTTPSAQVTPDSDDGQLNNGLGAFDSAFRMPTFHRSPPSQERASENGVSPPVSRCPSPYNRRNPPHQVPITSSMIPRASTIPIASPSSRMPHVLIVEDNSVNAMILATFLRKRGYPFAQAENGLLAVQAVQARPEGFDVILMDIQMPVMDGSSATAAIRTIESERGEKRAYIVALTGLAADKDRQVAFESGVDYFLTKPVSLKKLGEVVEDWERENFHRGFTMKTESAN